MALVVVSGIFAGQASAAVYETEVTYGVNFRSKPSTNSSIYRMLKKGETIHVIEQVNAYWLKVEDRNGKVGYISANDKYTDYDPYIAKATSGVNFRSQPKVANNIIGFIPKGESVKVIEKVNSYWLKIQYNGKTGYASINYFDYNPPGGKATGSQIVSTAKSYLGDFDYEWGAEPWNTNYKKSDCSAFVQLVFNKIHGYDLPRTSIKQSKVGTKVSKSNLKPGDLVFFDTKDNGIVNHVGIYIGDGKFIHSAPSNNVGISSIETGYWSKHFHSARRVL
jgi:cell wall-associated NlpC family hydrolase